MNRIAVLMSTYNGEKYLCEQIDSILKQEKVKLTLYIRDDGSTDRTIEIISSYVRDRSNIVFIKGENVGVGNSFMKLVYDAADDYDYYAFADQDDVWLPNKISKALDAISGNDVPFLYCSNQILVDKDLNRIGMRFEQSPDTSYLQILCQNKMTGCTMVWNKVLNRLLKDRNRRPKPELLQNRIHDVWVAMVASIVGNIYFDMNSYIKYRQHENNVVGVRKTIIVQEWIKKIQSPTQRNGRSILCSEILRCYEDMINDNELKDYLIVVSEYMVKIRYMLALLKDDNLREKTGETKAMFDLKVLLHLI